MGESLTNQREEVEKGRCKLMIKDLYAAKACYFFQYFMLGSYGPIIFVYLVSTGLTVGQVGLVAGIRPIFGAISSFIVGYLVDHTGKAKLITLSVLILNMIVLISTPFVLLPFYDDKHLQKDSFFNSSNNTSTNVTFNATNVPVENDALFYVAVLWFILMALTSFPLLGLVDRAVINTVKQQTSKASYGMQRVFGPIGFTAASFIVGIAVDLYQPSLGLNKYSIAFMVLAPACVFFLYSICCLPMKPQEDSSKKQSQDSILKCLYQVCTNVSFVVFLITLLITGCCFNVILSYLLLLLKEMNTSNTLMGAIVSISFATEIIMFPIAKKIKTAIGGTYVCLCLAVFAYAIRLFLFSIAQSPWHILPVQLLHAFSHGLFWVAVMEYAFKMSTVKISQTVFSVVNIVFYMFSSILANIGGGYIFDLIGSRKLFMWMSIICCCWGIIMIIFYIAVERHRKVTVEIKDETSLMSKV